MRTETYYKLSDFDTLSPANETHRKYGRLSFCGRNGTNMSCHLLPTVLRLLRCIYSTYIRSHPKYDAASKVTTNERNARHIVPFVPIDSTLVHLVPTNLSPLHSSFPNSPQSNSYTKPILLQASLNDSPHHPHPPTPISSHQQFPPTKISSYIDQSAYILSASTAAPNQF